MSGELISVEVAVSKLCTEAGHENELQLGLSLSGSRDLNKMAVYVCGIRPGSLMDQDGSICVGDQLLEVRCWYHFL
ncbi:unnamed protein product [Protopolystoma xenopodis]|uniref:PDZ domain-containing protein n=1 Tax=Protopolystoma xenopodis TaxID=117903 RepID=A0A448WVL5_9PLAT|nr:unnamed protein product [Protopolystoma xenopodis]